MKQMSDKISDVKNPVHFASPSLLEPGCIVLVFNLGLEVR
jgi:hypothetical protein